MTKVTKNNLSEIVLEAGHQTMGFNYGSVHLRMYSTNTACIQDSAIDLNVAQALKLHKWLGSRIREMSDYQGM